jgi:hypothetical protein
MADARARHLRQLRKLRRSARGWSIRAGLLSGATAILVPYEGLGLPDAFWAAAAGGSLVVAAWRWIDHREMAALPVPEPPDPALAGRQARDKLIAAVQRFPAGRTAMDELRRGRTQFKMRGLAVAQAWRRLDKASATLRDLSTRLGGPAEGAVLEAAVAEQSLRELANRTASVERAMRIAPADVREPLADAHTSLLEQLDSGVIAYERLVAAAAGFVAEDGRTGFAAADGRLGDGSAMGRLADATELLKGIALGLAELRESDRAPRPGPA